MDWQLLDWWIAVSNRHLFAVFEEGAGNFFPLFHRHVMCNKLLVYWMSKVELLKLRTLHSECFLLDYFQCEKFWFIIYLRHAPLIKIDHTSSHQANVQPQSPAYYFVTKNLFKQYIEFNWNNSVIPHLKLDCVWHIGMNLWSLKKGPNNPRAIFYI